MIAMLTGRPLVGSSAVAGLIALALGGCSSKPDTGSADGNAPMPVTVAMVTMADLADTFDAGGVVQARTTATITARIVAPVREVRAVPGDHVRGGQVLVVLDSRDLAALARSARAVALAGGQAVTAAAADQEAADAALTLARATHGRITALQAKRSATMQELDEATATLHAAEARAGGAAARAKQASSGADGASAANDAAATTESFALITAPFDGVVTERNVHVGSLVTPSSTSMLRVQQISTLRLVVAVPETAVSGTQPGERIEFSVPAYPGEPFSGTLARSGRAIDIKTRTMPVEVDVPNRDGRLAPGMFANVAWRIRRPQPSLFVPGTAIATTTERTFVVRIRDGQTEWVDVKRGVTTENQLVEVFGNLHAGDQVAVRGTDELRAGTRVRVTQSR